MFCPLNVYVSPRQIFSFIVESFGSITSMFSVTMLSHPVMRLLVVYV